MGPQENKKPALSMGQSRFWDQQENSVKIEIVVVQIVVTEVIIIILL